MFLNISKLFMPNWKHLMFVQIFVSFHLNLRANNPQNLLGYKLNIE
jgi:hypothetical protein